LHPLLINMVEGGRTPILPLDELATLGFRIILYPTVGIRAVMKALGSLYTEMRANGGTSASSDRIVAFEERNQITGLKDYEELERRYQVR